MKHDIEQLRNTLEPGDVILFHGKSFVNWAVRTITQSYWGHAAMYIGNGLYIESIAAGVYINDLKSLKDANIIVYRHVKMNDKVAQKIVESVRDKSKSGYDFWAIWHLFKLLITGKRRKNNEKVGVENRYICSELIAAAYGEMGLTVIDEFDYDEIVPADFDLSNNFKRIN